MLLVGSVRITGDADRVWGAGLQVRPDLDDWASPIAKKPATKKKSASAGPPAVLLAADYRDNVMQALPGMCTLHANSAREAVVKMCTLPLLAGENIGTAFVVPTVASSVDLVVHVGTDTSGQRKLREIVALPGRAEGGVIETADIFTTRDGRLVRADGYPPHPERFAALGFDLPSLLGDGPGRFT